MPKKWLVIRVLLPKATSGLKLSEVKPRFQVGRIRNGQCDQRISTINKQKYRSKQRIGRVNFKANHFSHFERSKMGYVIEFEGRQCINKTTVKRSPIARVKGRLG